MKSTAVVSEPGPGAEALIKEARRRQRRRYAATGVAVVAVAAAALGAFAGLHGAVGPRRVSPPRGGPAAGHPAGQQVPGAIPGSVDTTVLMWPGAPRAGRHDRARQPAHRQTGAGRTGCRPRRVPAGHAGRRLDRLRRQQQGPGR